MQVRKELEPVNVVMRKIQPLADGCAERADPLRVFFGFKTPLKQRRPDGGQNGVVMALLVKELPARHIRLGILLHLSQIVARGGLCAAADREIDDQRAIREPCVVRVKRFFQRQHALRAGARIRVWQQQAKLIAADARENLVWQHARLEYGGGRLNHAIPDIIPERVVDQLQSVDVYKHDGQRQERRLIECFFRIVVVLPVMKARELVVIAQILDLQELKLGLCIVDDNPFERGDLSRLIQNGLMDIEHPFSLAGRGQNLIFILIAFVRGKMRQTILPNGFAILRADDVAKRDPRVVDELLRQIPRQLKAAGRDKPHRPTAIIRAAVCHTRQVRQQHALASLALAQRFVGFAKVCDIHSGGKNARYLSVAVAQDRVAPFDLAHLVVGGDNAVFLDVGRFDRAVKDAPHHFINVRALLLWHKALHPLFADDLFFRKPQRVASRSVDHRDIPFPVKRHEQHRRNVKIRLCAIPLPNHDGLCFFPLRNIARDAADAALVLCNFNRKNDGFKRSIPAGVFKRERPPAQQDAPVARFPEPRFRVLLDVAELSADQLPFRNPVIALHVRVERDVF